MAHDLDRGEKDRKARLVSQASEKFDAEMRKRIKAMLDVPDNRMVVSHFIAQIDIDASPFSPNAMTQSHAIGKQDAAKWWINAIRAACPEKELPMRREYEKALQSIEDMDGTY
jgi:hypothetical protein